MLFHSQKVTAHRLRTTALWAAHTCISVHKAIPRFVVIPCLDLSQGLLKCAVVRWNYMHVPECMALSHSSAQNVSFDSETFSIGFSVSCAHCILTPGTNRRSARVWNSGCFPEHCPSSSPFFPSHFSFLLLFLVLPPPISTFNPHSLQQSGKPRCCVHNNP